MEKERSEVTEWFCPQSHLALAINSKKSCTPRDHPKHLSITVTGDYTAALKSDIGCLIEVGLMQVEDTKEAEIFSLIGIQPYTYSSRTSVLSACDALTFPHRIYSATFLSRILV